MNVKQATKRWDQRLFTILWIWISFRTFLPWLVSFRLLFEGDGYSWGADYFGHMFYSSGMARPDFLLIPALLMVSLTVMFLLRRQNFRLGAPLLVAFLGFFAANALYQLVSGEPVIFEGDTLGVKMDVSLFFFFFNFSMFAVAVAWWLGVRDVPRGPGPKIMANWKRWIVRLCLAIVPIQLYLLIGGEPHGTTDEIGVIITLSQWALLAWCLYPGSAYRTAP